MCIDTSYILLDRANNALFFATLKRRAGGVSLAGSCFFLIKIFNFYQKKQLPSKEAPPARLLSVAKNSALFALSSNMYA